MRAFSYKTNYKSLLMPDIVSYLTEIHEQKGQQVLLADARKDALAELLEIARIQSTEASNRIEGIITTSDRLNKLVRNKTTPKNRSECEIAGYRDVLATIHENYDYIPIRSGMILQLHRDLYKFSGLSIGGSFKNADNVIAEELPDGTRRVRFDPVPAWETPEAMDELCKAVNEALSDPEMDPLLLIPMFILDFLCIHPFNDGNGRMSRLLTLLLTYRSGYDVGKYVSIEAEIERTKTTYYEALAASSAGWAEGEADYAPFITYMLGVMAACYADLDSRVALLSSGGKGEDILRAYFAGLVGAATKRKILDDNPTLSRRTAERALQKLQAEGVIEKVGAARATAYRRIER